MIVLAVGHMNVSVGAIGGPVRHPGGRDDGEARDPHPAAIVLGLLIGVLCGLINGWLTIANQINSFIITLAT